MKVNDNTPWSDVSELEVKLEKAKAALEFYANSSIYYNDDADADCGELARKTLKELDAKEGEK